MNKESESDDDFMVDSIIKTKVPRRSTSQIPDKEPEFPFLSQNELINLKRPRISQIHQVIHPKCTKASISSSTPRVIHVQPLSTSSSSSTVSPRIMFSTPLKSQDDLYLNRTTKPRFNTHTTSHINTHHIVTVPTQVLSHPQSLSPRYTDYSTDSDETNSIESSPEFLLCNDPIITSVVLDDDNQYYDDNNNNNIKHSSSLKTAHALPSKYPYSLNQHNYSQSNPSQSFVNKSNSYHTGPYITSIGSVDDNLLTSIRRYEDTATTSNLTQIRKETVSSTISKSKKHKQTNRSNTKKKPNNHLNKKVPKKIINRLNKNNQLSSVIKISKSSVFRRTNSNNSNSSKKLKPLRPNFSRLKSTVISKATLQTSLNPVITVSTKTPATQIILLSTKTGTSNSSTGCSSSLLNHQNHHHQQHNSYITTHLDYSTDYQDSDSNKTVMAISTSNTPPPPISHTQSITKKRKHLLEFIIDLLEENHPCVEWVDRDDKEFIISQPDALTSLWAEYKNNNKMTFDSLARSLRLYYGPKKLERISGKKHHYRLLPKAFSN